MKFTKMQGLGNDYIYIYGEVQNPEELSQKLSERHFGIGSDGIVIISPSDVADFKMRIFNADGSEAKMCGNGIRCVGKYVFDKSYTDKQIITVETLSGIKTLNMTVENGEVSEVSVQMGKAVVSDDITLEIDGKKVLITPVSVGNPHAVIFVDDAKAAPVAELGRKIETHDSFPGGVNVEFVEVMSGNCLRMRVWERGSGITMACGTGACASVAASAAQTFCRTNEFVSVELDGGTLKIKIDDNGEVTMVGPAEIVFEGEIKP